MNTRKQLIEARIELVRNFLVILKLENSSVYHRVVSKLPQDEAATIEAMAQPTYKGAPSAVGVSLSGGTPKGRSPYVLSEREKRAVRTHWESLSPQARKDWLAELNSAIGTGLL